MAKNNCDDCVFYVNTGCGSVRYCNYIFRVGHSRPCPPGDECTVKIGRQVNRRKKKGDEDGK